MALVIGLLAIIALAFSLYAAGGAALMLLLGVLYAEFGLLAPLGFWPSLGIFALLSLVVNLIKPSKIEVG